MSDTAPGEREIGTNCPACGVRIDVRFSGQKGVIDWDGCPCADHGYVDFDRWFELLEEQEDHRIAHQ